MTERAARSDDGPPPPRKNPDLIGHEAAERRFLDAWNARRLPHAWLITGARGVGKATLAFRIARFVLAGGGEPGGLFGDAPAALHLAPDHPVFRRVASGGHADLMTLQRTVNPDTGRLRGVIVVADVRAAGAFLSLTPAEGGWRVMVVDCADELNDNSANALLKMIEEPSERALILLVSHAPGRLAATIRSRCCRLALQPLATDAVVGLLGRYLPKLGKADAEALARLGEGSVGRALRLAEDGGLELYREMVGLLRPLPEIDLRAVHGFGERLGRRGAEETFRTASELLGWWLARMIRAGATGEAAPAVVPEEEGLAARLSGAAGLARWMEVWDKINRLVALSDTLSLDRKQVVLNLFSALQGAARG